MHPIITTAIFNIGEDSMSIKIVVYSIKNASGNLKHVPETFFVINSRWLNIHIFKQFHYSSEISTFIRFPSSQWPTPYDRLVRNVFNSIPNESSGCNKSANNIVFIRSFDAFVEWSQFSYLTFCFRKVGGNCTETQWMGIKCQERMYVFLPLFRDMDT